MKIVVCLKPVPDTGAAQHIDAASLRLARPADAVIDPLAEFALEAALRARDTVAGATVTVFAMAPEPARETLRKALALGADEAVLLSDPRLAGSDGPKTARVLAAALRQIGFDLVLLGTQSSDARGGYVPTMLAELLAVPALPNVRGVALDGATVRAERSVDGLVTELQTELPALASVSKEGATPRFGSLKGIMAAKRKEIIALDPAPFTALLDAASATRVEAARTPPARERAKIVDASDPIAGARAIVDLLHERSLR